MAMFVDEWRWLAIAAVSASEAMAPMNAAAGGSPTSQAEVALVATQLSHDVSQDYVEKVCPNHVCCLANLAGNCHWHGHNQQYLNHQCLWRRCTDRCRSKYPLRVQKCPYCYRVQEPSNTCRCCGWHHCHLSGDRCGTVLLLLPTETQDRPQSKQVHCVLGSRRATGCRPCHASNDTFTCACMDPELAGGHGTAQIVYSNDATTHGLEPTYYDECEAL